MEQKLKKLTGHNIIKLTSRGNTAILSALKLVKSLNPKKDKILIPDQGGWFTYKKYSKELNLDPVELKTDYGIIDLKELKERAKQANCIIYSDPAGYFAEQPVKEIYNICKKNNCLVILDITGIIGKKVLGKYADICLASFGKGKPINLGYGGFISSNYNIKAEEPFDKAYLKPLSDALNNLKQRHELFDKHNKKIKQDLSSFDIIHRDKQGINVIVKFSNEKEKSDILKYCTKNNYQYRLCPFSIRVRCKAVSIEVKRL